MKRYFSNSKKPTTAKRFKKSRINRVASIAQKVNKIINDQEKKIIDTTFGTPSSPDNTLFQGAGAVTLLSGVAQGDDNFNRIGRKITVVSLAYKFHLVNTVTTIGTNSPYGARIMFVWDKQPNGALPAVVDILQTTDITSPLSANNEGRFKVLKNHQLMIGQDPNVAMCEGYLKLDLHSKFEGTGSTIASIATGSLLMLTIACQTTFSAVAVSDNGYVRLRFKDD